MSQLQILEFEMFPPMRIFTKKGKLLSPKRIVFWNISKGDLTDVTLADEDSNSIPTDNANRAMWQCSDATWWPTLEPMQVTPPDDQMLNKCKLCQLVAQLSTDADGTN